jgi:hypothetical protein
MRVWDHENPMPLGFAVTSVKKIFAAAPAATHVLAPRITAVNQNVVHSGGSNAGFGAD